MTFKMDIFCRLGWHCMKAVVLNMSDMMLQCYNKACGAKFDSENNEDDSCQHHPGVPVFHDALKGWSCCKKRTTDFSEFLKIPGCATGRHNSEKPKDQMKPVVASNKVVKGEDAAPKSKPEVLKPASPVEEAPLERPSEDEPLIKLVADTTSSYDKSKVTVINKVEEVGIKIGTSCCNSGCKASYTGGPDDNSGCVHHPGSAVFHEGMKYWSCCQRKTSDFTSFLNQEGCQKGSHLWKRKEDAKTKCRYDWHQAGPNAVLSIFAKRVNAETSTFETNQVMLKIGLEFENGKHFDLQLRLFGVIKPTRSKVTVSMTKVEISMYKVGAMKWKNIGEEVIVPEEAPSDNVTETRAENGKTGAAQTGTNAEKAEDSDSDLDGIDDVTFD